ncbi:hypothetical protein FHS29_004543 [Saccharothrix tamanrassetensis]|uniref:Uncharacterized protein n=1 Tax=Saccharothrix tamanrassetensis TaxID=1051531 RepID=A0A841CPL3_9PSEU|nr:hypothetical protein [Saccharothrix tamanrassetensis]MBB5957935.1 hypothetical protein [Saccharothrix tamanrassetensis]
MSGSARSLSGVRGIAWSLVDELTRRPGGQGRELPVVVALGPRGSGKTALLDQIRDRCANQVPSALLDFQETGDARPSRVLTGLAFDLSRYVPQFGRMAFPRLWLCALVLAGNLNTADRPKALAGLNELMTKDRPLERHRAQVLDLARLAGEAGGLPGWAPDATNTLLNGLNVLSRWRMLRSVRKLSKGSPRDPRDLLVDLNKNDKGSPADRRAVDDIVFDAFLADLHQAFTGGLHRLQRTANCVILLDNAHTAEGRAFLAALLAARRRSGTRADHAAVFATSRTWNVEWNGAWRRPGTPPNGTDLPLPRTAGEADRDSRTRTDWDQWYLVGLGHLDDAATEDVVSQAGVDLPAGLPYRLTRGHPGGLRTLLDVVARQEEPPRGQALRGLLSLPADPDRPVSLADEALDALVQDLPPALREDLVTASAGRGIEFLSEPTVLASALPDGGGALYAFLVNNFLLALEPDQDGGTRPVLDPWLRTLLLHRLSRRAEDGPVGWTAVHRRCREYYEGLGLTTEASYHDLALGDVGAVVTALAGPFAEADRPLDQPTARAWLRDLDLITSAPNRPAPDADPLTQVERLIEDVPAADATLARLVASLWLSGDPLGDPGDTLRGRIEHAYSALAQHRGQGSILLYDRAERYRA